MTRAKLNCIQIGHLKCFQRSLRSDILWSWFVDEKFSITELADRIEKMVRHGTIDGKPYVEPVKVPTDEDARQRPWVMVWDFEDTKWELRKLLAVVEGSDVGKYRCLFKDGRDISSWHYCRFPTDDERREHGID